MRAINTALRNGRLNGFISETVATLEAVPKDQRSGYLSERAIRIDTVGERHTATTVGFSLRLRGEPEHHPGLKPVLSDRLAAAFSLGFRLLPSSRFGIPRPAEIDDEAHRIALTQWQQENIWQHLQRIADITDSIEARGVGRAVLEQIAVRIQARLDLPPPVAWFDGLESPRDKAEEKEIARAFAEWADGDSIVLHVAYDLDAFCTEDIGRSAGLSILDAGNRAWLTQNFGVRFLTLNELAACI